MSEKDFAKALSPLQVGTILTINIPEIIKMFDGKESVLAERLQYTISEYCRRRDEKDPSHLLAAERLISLCYAPTSLVGLTDPLRLTGSIAVILKYLNDNNIIEDRYYGLLDALDQKKELLASSKNANHNLFLIHYYLIEATVNVKNDSAIIGLTENALRPLTYISLDDSKTAVRISRNIKRVCSSLTDLSSATEILVKTQNLLSPVASVDQCLQEFIVKRLFLLTLNFSASDNLSVVEKKFQQEIPVYLKLTKQEDLQEDWSKLLMTMLSAKSPPSNQNLAVVRRILSATLPTELGRATLLLGSVLSSELYTAVHGQVPVTSHVAALYHYFFLPLLDTANSNAKGFTFEISPQRSVSIEEIVCRCCMALTLLPRLCLKHHPGQESLAVVPIIIHAFQVGYKFVHGVLSVTDSNANYVWSHISIAVVNSVENLTTYCLETPSAWEQLTNLCEVFVPSLCSSKITLPPPVARARISLLFDRWALSLTSGELWSDALLIRAVHVTACPWDIQNAMLSWFKLKSKTKVADEITFKEYMQIVSVGLQKYDVEISKVDVKDTLLEEARCYNEVHVPNALILRLWSQLKTLRPKIEELALGLCRLITAVDDNVNPSVLNKLRSEAEKVLSKLRDPKIAQGISASLAVYEGILRYGLFVLMVKERRNKIRSNQDHQVLLTQLKEEAEKKTKFGEEADMNVTCDVSPDTEGGVSEEANLLNALDAALTPLLAFSKLEEAKLSEKEASLTLDYLHMISNAAALIGDIAMAIKGYSGVYVIAHRHGNQQTEMRALSKLAAFACVTEDSAVMVRAQAIDSLSIADSSPSHLVALLHLRLSIVSVYLNGSNAEAARALLEGMSPRMEKVTCPVQYGLLKGRYLHLLSHLCLLTPAGEVVSANDDVSSVQRVVYRAFYYIKSALDHSHQDTEHFSGFGSCDQGDILLTTLEVSTWCADVFMTLLLTPYVRAFLEDIYMVCQRLGLVTRTAQLLTKLIQVDVVTRQYTEVAAKFENLQSMLALPPLRDTKVEACTLKGNLSAMSNDMKSSIECHRLARSIIVGLDGSSWDQALNSEVDSQLQPLHSKFFLMEVMKQQLTSSLAYAACSLIPGVTCAPQKTASLAKNADTALALLTGPRRALLTPSVLELHVCVWAAKHFQSVENAPSCQIKQGNLLRVDRPVFEAKTPQPALLKRPMPVTARAPVRGGDAEHTDRPPSPESPKRRGRRIFEDTPKPESSAIRGLKKELEDLKTPLKTPAGKRLVIFEDETCSMPRRKKENVPKTTEKPAKKSNRQKMLSPNDKPLEANEGERSSRRLLKTADAEASSKHARCPVVSAATSVKVPKTGRRGRRPLIQSDSEDEIPGTPSPITKSSRKATHVPSKTRVAIPLVLPPEIGEDPESGVPVEKVESTKTNAECVKSIAKGKIPVVNFEKLDCVKKEAAAGEVSPEGIEVTKIGVRVGDVAGKEKHLSKRQTTENRRPDSAKSESSSSKSLRSKRVIAEEEAPSARKQNEASSSGVSKTSKKDVSKDLFESFELKCNISEDKKTTSSRLRKRL